MPFSLAAVSLRDIDRHDDVGRRILAFGGDALLKTLVEEQHLRLDAGLGGEGVEHRLDQIGLPVGVDVDGAVGHRRAGKTAARTSAALALNSRTRSLGVNHHHARLLADRVQGPAEMADHR